MSDMIRSVNAGRCALGFVVLLGSIGIMPGAGPELDPACAC